MNKGDSLKVDKNNIVCELVMDDGQYGYRMLFPDIEDNEQAHKHVEKIADKVTQCDFEVEYFNHKISAVNANNARRAQELEHLLQELIARGEIVAFDTIR
jgi:hypothetical protein